MGAQSSAGTADVAGEQRTKKKEGPEGLRGEGDELERSKIIYLS